MESTITTSTGTNTKSELRVITEYDLDSSIGTGVDDPSTTTNTNANTNTVETTIIPAPNAPNDTTDVTVVNTNTDIVPSTELKPITTTVESGTSVSVPIPDTDTPTKKKSYFYSDPTVPTFRAYRDKNKLARLKLEQALDTDGAVNGNNNTTVTGSGTMTVTGTVTGAGTGTVDVCRIYSIKEQHEMSAAERVRDIQKLNQSRGNKCIGIRSGVCSEDISNGMEVLKNRVRPLKLNSIEYRIDTGHSYNLTRSEQKLVAMKTIPNTTTNTNNTTDNNTNTPTANSNIPDTPNTATKLSRSNSNSASSGSFARRYSAHMISHSNNNSNNGNNVPLNRLALLLLFNT